MTRQKFVVGAVAAAFSLSLTPAAWAGQAGGRPNTTGSSSGSAVPRGGEGSSSSGSSSSGSSTSGSSSSSGSSTSGSSVDGSRSNRERAPQRPQAVPRGSGSATAAGRPSGGNASAGDDGRRRADGPVPTYSRPRDGNAIGTAVERRGPRPGGGGGTDVIYYPYDPYYGYYGGYSSRYGYSPYWGGIGFGYFGYDPYMFGGYGGYDYGAPSYAGGYSSQYREVGNLRLKVKPRHAQVYVDGYFVGEVDSFDGVFQRLGIEAGPHRVELRAEGYETVEFEVLVTPGETVTYKGDMRVR